MSESGRGKKHGAPEPHLLDHRRDQPLDCVRAVPVNVGPHLRTVEVGRGSWVWFWGLGVGLGSGLRPPYRHICRTSSTMRRSTERSMGRSTRVSATMPRMMRT